jgi:hypothetical protein
MPQPQYSFAEGIHLSIDRYNCLEGSVLPNDHSISYDDIRGLEEQLTRDKSSYVQLREEIDASSYVTVNVPPAKGRLRRGQEVSFEYSELNTGVSSDVMVAITLGWGANYRRPGTARGIAALAIALGVPCVVMNPLGQGNSSPLPRAIAIADRRAGSYSGQGALYGQALASVKRYDNASLKIGIAESRGVRLKLGALAAGYAEDIGVYCDVTGFPGLGFNGLRRAMDQEQVHAKQYAEHHNDPGLKK